MLPRHAVTDAQWDRIRGYVPTAGPRTGARLFVDAVVSVARTGVPWRDLPGRFGTWNTVWRRFDRLSRAGVREKVFDALQDPDLEWLILDATVVRAHPCAAGANNTRTGPGARTTRPSGGVGAGSGPRSTSG